MATKHESNYRPFSILPVFSEIFQSIMKKHISFLRKNNILNDKKKLALDQAVTHSMRLAPSLLLYTQL